MDFSRFVQHLWQNCLVKPDDVLLVGVSGGADSICLLDILQKAGIKVMVANYNHHLRPESDADSAFVKQVADSQGLEFIQGSGDVLQFARKAHKTIEEAARIYRYDFLFEQAVKRGVMAVAVGHNADDQVETILMHLIRGCGMEGLQGMQSRTKSDFNQEIYLIRPLLFVWREEVIDYCKKNHLSYLEDSSNTNIKYFRNRLRLELIPELQQYNLSVKKHIYNLGKIVSGDLEYIIQASRANYKECLINEDVDFIALSLSKILNIADSHKRRVIQMALKNILPSGNETNFDLVEKVINFLQNPNQGKHLGLVSHLDISIEGDCIYLFKKGVQLPHYKWPMVNREFSLEISVPGEWNISPNWIIKTEFISITDIRFPDYSGQLITFAFLNADELDKRLLIRTQMPGDRYSSLGLKGKSQKLSDFWINNKVPKRVRPSWPLVLCEDKIIWIPGFQPSYFRRISEETRKAIRIEIVKMNE